MKAGSGSAKVIWPAAILLLVVVVYLPSLTNGINIWDDKEYLNNPFVNDISWAGITRIFSVYFAGNYHPLTLLSLGLDLRLSGGHPIIFHLTNLLLHVFNCCLVYILVKRLTQSETLALITILLFGLHTLHVESVAWVAERKDVLYSFFFLLSLVCYAKYISGNKSLYYIASLAFFFLSLLSKGQAVVLVAVLPLIDYLKEKKLFHLKSLIEKTPFLLLSIIFAWVAIRAQQSAGYVHSGYFSFAERMAFASFGLTQYLLKSILPTALCAWYPYPVKVAGGGIPMIYWFYMLIIPAFAIGSYFMIRRSRIYTFGLIMFLICILPMLQLMPVGGAIMADRYFYIPSVGLILCFSMGLMEIRNTTVRYGLLSIFALLLSVSTYTRCSVWKDNISLWNDEVLKNLSFAPGYFNRGTALYQDGQPDAAIADLGKATELDPGYAEAYLSRGNVYESMGQLEKAISDYSSLTGISPNDPGAYNNLGVASGKAGKWENAIKAFSRAIELDPGYADAFSNRGNLWLSVGQWDKAIEDCSKAISIDARNVQAYDNRGIAYLRMNQPDKALEDCSRAIELDQKFSKAYNDRGFTYSLIREFDKAIADYSIAISINPGYIDALNNRGVAFLNMGHWNEAIEDFSGIININPQYLNAWNNRGYAYSNIGQWKNAISDFSHVLDIDPGNAMAHGGRQNAMKYK